MLVEDNCALALKGVTTKPITMSVEEWDIMDVKARANIHPSLIDSVLFNVVKETTVKGLWGKLNKLYEMKSLSNMIFSETVVQSKNEGQNANCRSSE